MSTVEFRLRLEQGGVFDGSHAESFSIVQSNVMVPVVASTSSDVPGPAQSQKPSQAEPVWAGPSQAIGDGPAMALARLRVAESQSRRLRPRLCQDHIQIVARTFDPSK
jgi:hypothetical protein